MWRVRRPKGASEVLWQHICQVVTHGIGNILNCHLQLPVFYEKCARASRRCVCLRELQHQRWHHDRVLHRSEKLKVLSVDLSYFRRHSHNKRQDGSLHLHSVSRDRPRCWEGGKEPVQQDGGASQDVPPRRHLLEWQQDHHKVGWKDNEMGYGVLQERVKVPGSSTFKLWRRQVPQKKPHDLKKNPMTQNYKWKYPVASGTQADLCGSSTSSGWPKEQWPD